MYTCTYQIVSGQDANYQEAGTYSVKNRKNDKTAAQHTVCQRTRFVFSDQQASPGVNKFSKVQGSWD